MYKEDNKPVIYQVLPRLFGNTATVNVPSGTLEQNGCGKMNCFDSNVLKAFVSLGVTHIWYTGIQRHALKTDYTQYGIPRCNPHVVKGVAGSPYAIIDYYDVDPDIAVDVNNRMREFNDLVARTHSAGLKVIIDFVPNHVAREYYSVAAPAGAKQLGQDDDRSQAFSPNNNFYYMPGKRFDPRFDIGRGQADEYVENPARATGNDCFSPTPGEGDWFETIKLNYGVDYTGGTGNHFNPIPDTWHKMLDILLFWATQRVDGFRCDMVHMVPPEFWHWAINKVKEQYPDIIFIAEIYDPNLYRHYLDFAGFDFLYDKVGLYDTLVGITRGERPASDITRCWQSLEGIADRMLNFLENHDEVRVASPYFAGNAFNAIPALVVAATLNRAPFMLYFGQELGEPGADAEGYSGFNGRTTIFDHWSIDTIRRWYNHGRCNPAKLTVDERNLRKFYRRLLHIVNGKRPIVWGKMYDLMYCNLDRLNPHRHYAYLRHHDNEVILVVANFDNYTTRLDINIPDHVIDFMNVNRGRFLAKELLDGTSEKEILFDGTIPFHVEVQPYNAVMWHWRATKNKK